MESPFLQFTGPSFPGYQKTVEIWRLEAAKYGMELYLGYMQSFKKPFPPEENGFDVAIDFEPDFYTKL